MGTERGLTFPWQELILSAGVVALLAQLFPNALSAGIGLLDVRNWGWGAIAVVNAGVIVGLVGLKAMQNRRDG